MDGGGRTLAGGEEEFYEGPNGGGGGGRGGDARRGFRGTAENAKTKLCMRWMSPEGCRFGDRCNFAHGEHELKKLPPRGGGGPGGGGRGGGGRGGGFGGGGWQEGYGDNRGQPGYDDFYRGGYGMQRPPFPGGPGGFPGGGPFPQGGMPPGGNGPGNGYPPLGGAQGPPGSGLAVGQGRTPHESVENMAWIASGCPVTGPGGWTQYRCQETGEYYYHNHRTQGTTWDKPAEWGP